MKDFSAALRVIAMAGFMLIAPLGFADTPDLTQQVITLKNSLSQKEHQYGSYSAQLYSPVRELALAQKASGDYSAAIDSFRRMQHLVHRHHGVYDARQLESVDLIIDAYYSQGVATDLDREQHFRFRVVEKSFASNSIEFHLAKMKLADWYRNSGRLSKASNLYNDLLDEPEIDSSLRVRLLRSEALARYLAGRCCATEPLQEALDIIETDNVQPIELSQALGDFIDMAYLEDEEVGVTRAALSPAFLGFQKPRHILTLMANSRSRDPTSDFYMDFGERKKNDPAMPTIGSPVSMCGNTYDSLVVKRDRELAFNVSLVIDDKGHPAEVSVVGDGPIRLKRYLKSSLLSAKYRPATTSDGQSTTATLSFRQTFPQQGDYAGSLAAVTDWSNMLVSQTCQIAGVQKI